MNTLKLLAVLLTYPTAELRAALPEIARRLATDRKLRHTTQDGLAGLLAELGRGDLLDAQERYVAQFDFGRATSLHLFEHVHGDSRDRGQAMVDLEARYRDAGLVLAANQLPDFLPVLLEYLATRRRPEVQELLDDCGHILRAIGERLNAGGSPYAAVFAALLDLQGAAPLPLQTARAADRSAPVIDDDWAEASVAFGPNTAAHGMQQSRPQFVRFVPKNP